MKAAVYDHTGGPEVLRYADVPDPECFPGAVVIEVAAISIEGGDTLNRAGGDMSAVPHVVGWPLTITSRISNPTGRYTDTYWARWKSPPDQPPTITVSWPTGTGATGLNCRPPDEDTYSVRVTLFGHCSGSASGWGELAACVTKKA